MGTTQLVKKAIKAVKEEGIQGCAKKTKSYLENQKRLRRKIEKKYKDILIGLDALIICVSMLLII